MRGRKSCAALLWIGAFVLPWMVHAADAGSNVLTLQDAERMALENHPGIRAATERVKVQEAVVQRAWAGYFPTLDARGVYENRTVESPLADRNLYNTTGAVGWLVTDFGPPRRLHPTRGGHPGSAPLRQTDIGGRNTAHGAAVLLRVPPGRGAGAGGPGYGQGPRSAGAAGPGLLRRGDPAQDRRGPGGSKPIRRQGGPHRSPERRQDRVGPAQERHGRDTVRATPGGRRGQRPAADPFPGGGGGGGLSGRAPRSRTSGRASTPARKPSDWPGRPACQGSGSTDSTVGSGTTSRTSQGPR